MRRIFINNIISKFIFICKNKVNGKNQDIYTKMCFLTENDLFSNEKTSFPLMDNAKICKFENSKMFKSLYITDEELKETIKTIKYFEEFIQKNFKNEEKFELFTENIITMITLGIYMLIDDENNIKDLFKSEEEALLGFLGVHKLKNKYTKEEEKINLNQDIFLYGNIRDINDISKEELNELYV